MTESHGAEEEREDHSGAKGQGRQLIGAFLFDALWIGIDLWFVWPLSHVAALWFAIGALAIQVYGSSFSSHARHGALLALALLGIIGQRFLPPTETETHGWLVPRSSDAVGTNFTVYLGTIGLGAANTDNRIPMVTISGEPLWWARRVNDQIAVSARIFDNTGLVAKIRDNEFESNRGALAIVRPDPHTLIVQDQWDHPIARIDYINPSTLKITGRFWYRDSKILVADDRGVFEEDPMSHSRSDLFGGGWELYGGEITGDGFEIGSGDQNK